MTLKTEAQAKTKWCPMGMVRVQGKANPAANAQRNEDDDQIVPLMFCVGSACMMWRRRAPSMREQAQELGYCGLAGRPDE